MSDEQLREHERRAALGDPDAARAYLRAWYRAGEIPDLGLADHPRPYPRAIGPSAATDWAERLQVLEQRIADAIRAGGIYRYGNADGWWEELRWEDDGFVAVAGHQSPDATVTRLTDASALIQRMLELDGYSRLEPAQQLQQFLDWISPP